MQSHFFGSVISRLIFRPKKIVVKLNRGFTIEKCIQTIQMHGMANSVSPDHTALTDLGLHYLLRPACQRL